MRFQAKAPGAHLSAQSCAYGLIADAMDAGLPCVPLSDRHNSLYGTSEFHGALMKGVGTKPQCCVSHRGYPERQDARGWDRIILAHSGVASTVCGDRRAVPWGSLRCYVRQGRDFTVADQILSRQHPKKTANLGNSDNARAGAVSAGYCWVISLGTQRQSTRMGSPAASYQQ